MLCSSFFFSNFVWQSDVGGKERDTKREKQRNRHRPHLAFKTQCRLIPNRSLIRKTTNYCAVPPCSKLFAAIESDMLCSTLLSVQFDVGVAKSERKKETSTASRIQDAMSTYPESIAD
mmetsp:Transcript_7464/g.33146  ORF Transcript_7464/g.33146 Transcript_7464/m.33146 type:complete len:118 (+) Transcript_7464:177-530(+)